MTLYRHVDILNSAGIRAYALHGRRGFRYTWFDNQTPVTSLDEASIHEGDLVVVSELDIDLVPRLPKGVRHVIFNQSGHLTWDRGRELVNRHCLTSPDLAAVVTVSEHSRTLVQYAFPKLDVRRIHHGLNKQRFYPGDEPRGRRIAYMPRPGRGDEAIILSLLNSRNSLEGWELVALGGQSHSEVARQLRTTRIFLALSYQEGFGLPAAEAMACGNYVIGYHGFGGREFFDKDFSCPVEAADVMGFVSAIEDVIRCDEADPTWCWTRGLRASQFVLGEYSPERERSEVVAIYSDLLGKGRQEAGSVERELALELSQGGEADALR